MTTSIIDQAPLPSTFGKREAGGGGELTPDACARCHRPIERPAQIRRAWCGGCTMYFAINGIDPRREVAR